MLASPSKETRVSGNNARHPNGHRFAGAERTQHAPIDQKARQITDISENGEIGLGDDLEKSNDPYL